jgi:hypothetical protein
VGHGPYARRVADRADLRDRAQDDVELRGQRVELVVGQRQPGQPGEVRDLAAADLRHAASLGAIVAPLFDRGPTRPCNTAVTSVGHAGRVSYLLRVVLPDRPGMLGAVASALGECGADIVSLDVVERGPEGAVDDLLVELPPGVLVDRLITGAQSVPGVFVESLRPYAGAADLHGDLELVDALAAAPESALQVLVDHAPGVFRAGWALLVREGRVVSGSRGAPEVRGVGLPAMPQARRVELREEWVPEAWRLLGIELAGAPVGDPRRVVLLGRSGGPLFRASEVLRLGHLAGITATVNAAVPVV